MHLLIVGVLESETLYGRACSHSSSSFFRAQGPSNMHIFKTEEAGKVVLSAAMDMHQRNTFSEACTLEGVAQALPKLCPPHRGWVCRPKGCVQGPLSSPFSRQSFSIHLSSLLEKYIWPALLWNKKSCTVTMSNVKLLWQCKGSPLLSLTQVDGSSSRTACVQKYTSSIEVVIKYY